MPSLIEQRKALTATFNSNATAMQKFIEEKNPLGFGGTNPTSEVVEEFQKMHDSQVKHREEIDKVEELLTLSTEIKDIETKPADVDLDALVEQRMAALKAQHALTAGGNNGRRESDRFTKTLGLGTPAQIAVLDPERIGEAVGKYLKSRGVKREQFEKNGSNNLRFLFTWGGGQEAHDKFPQAVAAGAVDRKSLRQIDTSKAEEMKALYTYSVNNTAYTGTAAGELGYSCNLDIDPDICTIDIPDFCLTSCIPTRPTTGGRIWYTRQTVRAPAAAGVKETELCDTGVLKPESGYGFATIEVPVITLAHVVCASDEALDDCSAIIDMIRTMMREDLMRKERQYMISGTGAGGDNPQYRGILNTSGIVTHTFRGSPRGISTDNIPDAVRRAKTDIMLAGKTPDCLLINVRDAERMDLAKSTTNNLLYPNATCQTGAVWCLNVCADADVPEGTAIVGGLRESARLYRRQEVVIEVGYVGDQFRLDEVTIRAKMRGAFALKCPQGIVRINSITT